MLLFSRKMYIVHVFVKKKLSISLKASASLSFVRRKSSLDNIRIQKFGSSKFNFNNKVAQSKRIELLYNVFDNIVHKIEFKKTCSLVLLIRNKEADPCIYPTYEV